MEKKEVNSNFAPKAVGPYSQAIKAGDFVFCSGQIGVNVSSNLVVDGGIKEQTIQVLKNLKAVLQVEGLTFDNIVKTTVYMTDLSEYSLMNEEYANNFSKPYPARATVQVVNLPRGVKIEIEAIACIYKISK